MIYKFKSRETGDLIMLAPDAERILALLGKVLKAPGIITLAEIADAKATLQAAALAANQQAAQNAAAADADDADNTAKPWAFSPVTSVRRTSSSSSTIRTVVIVRVLPSGPRFTRIGSRKP